MCDMNIKEGVRFYKEPMGVNALCVPADELEILKSKGADIPHKRRYTVNGGQSLPGTSRERSEWKRIIDEEKTRPRLITVILSQI